MGAKWNQAGAPSALPGSRRQPQLEQVTGPPATALEIPLVENTGYVIGLLLPSVDGTGPGSDARHSSG